MCCRHSNKNQSFQIHKILFLLSWCHYRSSDTSPCAILYFELMFLCSCSCMNNYIRHQKYINTEPIHHAYMHMDDGRNIGRGKRNSCRSRNEKQQQGLLKIISAIYFVNIVIFLSYDQLTISVKLCVCRVGERNQNDKMIKKNYKFRCFCFICCCCWVVGIHFSIHSVHGEHGS